MLTTIEITENEYRLGEVVSTAGGVATVLVDGVEHQMPADLLDPVVIDTPRLKKPKEPTKSIDELFAEVAGALEIPEWQLRLRYDHLCNGRTKMCLGNLLRGHQKRSRANSED